MEVAIWQLHLLSNFALSEDEQNGDGNDRGEVTFLLRSRCSRLFVPKAEEQKG